MLGSVGNTNVDMESYSTSELPIAILVKINGLIARQVNLTRTYLFFLSAFQKGVKEEDEDYACHV